MYWHCATHFSCFLVIPFCQHLTSVGCVLCLFPLSKFYNLGELNPKGAYLLSLTFALHQNIYSHHSVSINPKTCLLQTYPFTLLFFCPADWGKQKFVWCLSSTFVFLTNYNPLHKFCFWRNERCGCSFLA